MSRCYLGKRRLEAALAAFDGADDVEVRWTASSSTRTPPATYEGEHAERIARKYGRSREDTDALLEGKREMAASEGLELRFDRVRSGNTFDGHRLLALAAEHGLQGETKERLMRAHHTDGEVISDPETLRRIGADVGLPEGAVEELFASDAHGEQVRVDEHTAQQLGIDAVPFFVIDRRLAVRGAADAEQLLQALRQVGESAPAT